MSKFVKCGKCGTVYDMHGTHGTTVVNGYCPMCGLHHSGTHSIAYPVLKPSPLAAQPIDVPEQTCKLSKVTSWDDDGHNTSGVICSASDAPIEHHTGYGIRYSPDCGAKVVE